MPAIQAMIHYTSDKNEQILFLKKAATLGDIDSMLQLGSLYIETQEYEQAADFFQKASTFNNPYGTYNLAVCYFQGRGREKNINKAASLFKLAGDQKHPTALKTLHKYFKTSS